MTMPVTRFLLGIVRLCSRPLSPKLEMQHNEKRKRSGLTLIREEWLSREGNSMLIPKRKL
jgi:hypothetical protein